MGRGHTGQRALGVTIVRATSWPHSRRSTSPDTMTRTSRPSRREGPGPRRCRSWYRASLARKASRWLTAAIIDPPETCYAADTSSADRAQTGRPLASSRGRPHAIGHRSCGSAPRAADSRRCARARQGRRTWGVRRQARGLARLGGNRPRSLGGTRCRLDDRVRVSAMRLRWARRADGPRRVRGGSCRRRTASARAATGETPAGDLQVFDVEGEVAAAHVAPPRSAHVPGSRPNKNHP